MQGKGFVKLFAMLLLLIVAYQTALLFPTWSVEGSADDYARAAIAGKTLTPEDEQAELEQYRQQYLDSVSSEKVFLSFTYQSLKRQQLALGLDLKGGMSVVLQVDLRDLINNLSGESRDSDFLKAMDKAREMQVNAQADFVTLFGRAFEEIAPSKKLASIFVAGGQLSTININSSNRDVINAIRIEASKAVETTYQMLKQRIDRFGVAQPVVSLDKSTDRITVELPGVTNPNRARQLLQATASLEFWDVYRNTDNVGTMRLIDALQGLNEALKTKGSVSTDTTATDSTNAAVVKFDSTIVRIDSLKDSTGAVTSLDTVFAGDSTSTVAATDTNNFGPIFTKLSPMQQEAAIIGFALARDTASLNEIFNSAEAKKFFPKSLRFLWSRKHTSNTEQGRFFELYAIDTKGKKEAPLQGNRILNPKATSGQGAGGYAVELDMDNIGAQEWKKMTQRSIQREIAIVLDNQVCSAPVVQGVIANGNTQITGNFDAQEATDLANILAIGKLPTRTEIIEEAIVGPSLGEATVKAGLIALVVGFLSVLIFMLGYYSFAGFISVLALFFNLVVIISCLASFGTVLTLPGIAGIVLTIGMAVDANVIIFERMREEIRAGNTWADALHKGFAQSYSSIFDANITTLITAFILFQYGLGPIKGFATVLIVGVIASVFTAVFLGRLLFDYFSKDGSKELSVGNATTMNILSAPSINFMSKRKMAYAVSGAFIVAGLVSTFTRGFELGVDLQGGRSYTVEFAQAVEVDGLKEKLVASFDGCDKVIVKTFNEANQVKITTSCLQDNTDPNVDQIVLQKVYEGCKAYAAIDVTLEKFVAGDDEKLSLNATSKVGPTIADDIQQSAYWTAALALIGIFGYIFFRFRKWQYSAGAIIALMHDVLVTTGVFSLFKGILPFSLEVNQEFIAAILTVIGYSINDTVIVFDRIRETIRESAEKGNTLSALINQAINSTLSRTFMTSFTTLLVVILLFLFGGDSVRGFSFALLIGIGIGTYSSIFIASPIMVDFSKDNIDSMIEPENVPSVVVEPAVTESTSNDPNTPTV